MQQKTLNFLALIAFVALWRLDLTAATCGECYNSHACVGRNQFQVCINGVRDTTQNFTCEVETEVCTRFGRICFEESETIRPACGDISQCGNCENVEPFRFACMSRTTFTQCFNDAPYGTVGTCPDSSLCSVSSAAEGTPCVNHCSVDEESDICDRNADYNDEQDSTTQAPSTDTTTPESSTDSTPTTTTEETTTIFAPTPPDSTSTPPPVDVCASGAGRYAIPDDTACTSYVFCYWTSAGIRNRVSNCPTNNPYFNATTTLCGANQPTGLGCV